MDKKVLVTGATGFLGAHLMSRLDLKKVRVLAKDNLPEVEVDFIKGSILEEESVKRAVEGVVAIYHLAGKVVREPDDVSELYRVHVEGTSLLCRAAKEAGVKRIVLASTSGTIAVSSDGDRVLNETDVTPLSLIGKWPYYTSKLYQEQVARKECRGGPELIILNPSLLLGPGDRKLSSTGDILKFLVGDVPIIPPGGVSFVDVRDVAEAFTSAMERGKPGQSYLLGGPNWTFSKFFDRLGRISKVKGPTVKLPKALYRFTGTVANTFYDHWKRASSIDRVSLEMSECFWYLDASKAERELGFRSRDPHQTLNETVSYIKREFLD